MNSKLIELLSALTENTQAKKVKWERLDDKMFHAYIGPGLVRIGRGEDVPEDSEEYGMHFSKTYDIWILNDSGHVADEDRFVEGQPGFAEADKLFRAARSSTAKTDDVLNGMLATLSRK